MFSIVYLICLHHSLKFMHLISISSTALRHYYLSHASWLENYLPDIKYTWALHPYSSSFFTNFSHLLSPHSGQCSPQHQIGFQQEFVSSCTVLKEDMLYEHGVKLQLTTSLKTVPLCDTIIDSKMNLGSQDYNPSAADGSEKWCASCLSSITHCGD